MDAVLGVDLEAHVSLAAPLEGNILVDPCRAEPLFGTIVYLQVHLHRDVVVIECEMGWLVVLVVRVGEGHGCQKVEADFPIRLRVFDGFAVLGEL